MYDMQRAVEGMSYSPGDLGEMIGPLSAYTGRCLEAGVGRTTTGGRAKASGR